MRLHQLKAHFITHAAAAGALLVGAGLRAEAATIASQNFNGLSDAATETFDNFASGSTLTNGGSANANPLQGMTFETKWTDTRALTDGLGPVTTTSDTSDFIGVNSFSGSNSPDASPSSVSVASGVEHNFEFNDGDGRLDLIFDPIDTTGFTDRELTLAYWVAPTGFESDDSLVITLSDGITTATLLDISEAGLEAAGGGTEGPWLTLNPDIEALGLGALLTLTVSVDTNAGTENIFVDDIAFTGQPVPEPSTFVLIGLGSLGLLITRRRQLRRRF